MHKFRQLLILTFVAPAISLAQKMPVNYGVAKARNVPSIAVEALQANYDHAIAFTHEGYWQSNNIHYAIVALKKGVYYKGAMYLKRAENGTWPAPTEAKLKKINANKARQLIKYLSDSGLWQLSNDSLNNQQVKMPNGTVETLTVHDATNFRFEQITPTAITMISSYDPEGFLELKNGDKSRESFIKIRDTFLKRYKAL